MSKRSQILAELDTVLVKALKKTLIDDGLTYRAWLEQRVREYVPPEYLLSEPPKTKRRSLPRKRLKPRT